MERPARRAGAFGASAATNGARHGIDTRFRDIGRGNSEALAPGPTMTLGNMPQGGER